MFDIELRIIFTFDRGSLVGYLAYAIHEDGQGQIAAAQEVGPFQTRREISEQLVRTVMGVVPADAVKIR